MHCLVGNIMAPEKSPKKSTSPSPKNAEHWGFFHQMETFRSRSCAKSWGKPTWHLDRYTWVFLDCGLSVFKFSPQKLGKRSNLTSIFQMAWNQLVFVCFPRHPNIFWEGVLVFGGPIHGGYNPGQSSRGPLCISHSCGLLILVDWILKDSTTRIY